MKKPYNDPLSPLMPEPGGMPPPGGVPRRPKPKPKSKPKSKPKGRGR